MSLDLRANTAVDVLIGPFVDSTDGDTAEEGLTIEDEHVKLSKLGQGLAAKAETSNAGHDDDGYYNCPLGTADTGSEGTLVLTCHMSGALPVRHEYMVLSEGAWDSLYSANDDGLMDVNVSTIAANALTATAINADAITSAKIADDALGIEHIADSLKRGLIMVDTTIASDDRSTTTCRLTAGSDNDDAYIGMQVILDDDAGDGEYVSRTITDYTGATKLVTFTPAISEDADEGGVVYIVPGDTRLSGQISGLNNISEAEVNAQCDASIETYHLDHLLAADYTPESPPGNANSLFGELTENDSGVVRFTENALEQAPAGTGGDATEAKQDSIIAAVITNAAGTDIAADIIAVKAETATIVADTNELQTDDIPGTLSTIVGYLDTEIAAILEDTGTTLPATLSTMEGKIDTIDGIVDNILVDTGTTLPGEHAALPTAAEIQAEMEENGASILDTLRDDLVDGGRLDALIDAIKAKTDNLPADPADDSDIDTQLAAITALLDDARGEPGDAAPPVNPDAMTKIDYLYKFLRNKIETTATRIHVFNDAGTNKDHSSVISDDATTFTRGEFGAGDA